MLLSGAASGCRVFPELNPRTDLSHTPCNPRIVAALMSGGELTEQEEAYLRRCGVMRVAE